MTDEGGFRPSLRSALSDLTQAQSSRLHSDRVLSIDLHCHDRNSDVPDERIGRMLGSRETWVPTDQVVATLKRRDMDLITVTNHNNARSCWELLERGVDVLVGAEFTCAVPGHDVHVHVLTYGFDPRQEAQLTRLRRDLYQFLEYATGHHLVTVLAHPLFLQSARVPPITVLEKLSLMFEYFEGINGQRDTWQNLLVSAWVQSLDEECLDALGRKHGLHPMTFCRRPYSKQLTGGSDCHMALFCGTAGTRVEVPQPTRQHVEQPLSALVLEGLRHGRTAPFGSYTCESRLSAALLDFFCQAVMHLEDPGLLRMALHQGTTHEKLAAFFIANTMLELRRHRVTSRFLQAYHDSLHGRRPGFWLRRLITRPLRPLLAELDGIACAWKASPELFDQRVQRAVPQLFHGLFGMAMSRFEARVNSAPTPAEGTDENAADVIARLELPSSLRSLLAARPAAGGSAGLADWTDALSFPMLGAVVLGGAAWAGARVTYRHRPLLDEVAARLDRYQHPRRALWLTDSFDDRNGVAGSLRLLHEEVCRRDLPIDFAVCSGTIAPAEHLIVLEPVAELRSRFYPDQPLRVFDPLELQRAFIEGSYDRIVCSTEGVMGLAALYLKEAFSIPATFYVHTDWIDFARRSLRLDRRQLDRVRRVLRSFYNRFDRLLLLNSEQLESFSGEGMCIPKDRLRRTAHWAHPCFHPRPVLREQVFPGLRPHERLLLFAGRISEEKGVLELPDLVAKIRREAGPVRLALAGSGPAESALCAALPDAISLGWLSPEDLACAYSAADLLLLPSRFDTFGCVLLEALSCGLPVAAYAVKGPRDVVDERCGVLAACLDELAAQAARVLRDPRLRRTLSLGARERAAEFSVDAILARLIDDLGFGSCVLRAQTPAAIVTDRQARSGAAVL